MSKLFLARFVSCIFLMAAIITLSACRPSNEYTIGLPVSLTGSLSVRGQAIANSVKLYVDEINKNGGVDGHLVRLKILDDKSDPAVQSDNMITLRQDPSVLAVIGHPREIRSTAGSDLVILNPGLWSLKAEEKLHTQWTYNLAYSLERQRRTLAAYIRTYEPSSKLLLINAEGPENNTVVAEFEAFAKGAGLTTKRIDIAKPSDLDLSTEDIGSIVLYAPENHFADFIKTIHKFDPGISIYGDHRMTDEVEKGLDEPYFERVHGSSPFNFAMARFEAMQFRRKYERSFNVPATAEAAFAYDAAALIVDALKTNTGIPTRQSVREALSKRNSVETGLPGITARLYFDETLHTSRLVIVQECFDHKLRPAFRQLRLVPDNYTRDKEHDIVEVDGKAYFKQSVVYIGMDFSRLDSTDTQKGQISITGFMWMKWQGDFSPESISLQNAASPIQRVKLREGPFEREVHALPKRNQNVTNVTDAPIMYASYKVKLPIQYEYELADFPFDSQTIPITLSDANTDNNRLAFVADIDFLSDKKLIDSGWEQVGREDYAAYFYQESALGTYPLAERAKHQRTYSASYEILVEMKRVIFGYIFSLFVPLLACLLLCLLSFFIHLEDTTSKFSMLTGAFFITMLSHMSLRSSIGVSYLVAADLFYFITYAAIVAGIFAVILIDKTRQKDEKRALRVQAIARSLIVGASFVAFALTSAKYLL